MGTDIIPASHVKMFSQSAFREKLDQINVRLVIQFIGLFIVIYKIFLGILHISRPNDHGPIKGSGDVLFGVGLLFWGLMDVLLIIGAYKRIKLMIKIWICLNLVLIGMIFALMGLWHMTICILVFTIALLFGIASMKKIE